MIALTTLVFLVAGWAAFTASIDSIDDNGAKIVAALKGQSLLARDSLPLRQVTVRFSPRYPVPRSRLVRATAERRAAA